ncbi:MAG: hypothetical protein Kow0065_22200 [Methylomicrobium sp.]
MLAFDLSKPVIGKADIEIESSLTKVFDYVAAKFFDNYPKWALEVIEFEVLENKQVEVGAKAKQVRIEQGQKVESVFEITEYIPGEKLTLESVTGEFREIYAFKIGEQPHSTNLTFTFALLHVDFFMRPFEKLIRVAIEEGLQNSLENIRKLLIEHYGDKS